MKTLTITFTILFLLSLLLMTIEPALALGMGGQGFQDWLRGGTRSSLGLIDPAKLDISHNLSFDYATGGGTSLMQSVYMSRFGYRLSDPVTLTFLLGIQNSQLAGAPGYVGSYNSILGGVRLDYMPADNILLRFEVQHQPYNTYNSFMSNRFWAVSSNDN